MEHTNTLLPRRSRKTGSRVWCDSFTSLQRQPPKPPGRHGNDGLYSVGADYYNHVSTSCSLSDYCGCGHRGSELPACMLRLCSVYGLSCEDPRKFSPRNLSIRESFLPRKFPVMHSHLKARSCHILAHASEKKRSSIYTLKQGLLFNTLNFDRSEIAT